MQNSNDRKNNDHVRHRTTYKKGNMRGEPIIHHLSDGNVRVQLFGKGDRYFMTLNDCDLETALELTKRWVVNNSGSKTCPLVRAGGKNIARYAQQNGNRPVVTLSRVLASAQPGQRVLYRDGDTLNLRRSNLWLQGEPTTPAAKAA